MECHCFICHWSFSQGRFERRPLPLPLRLPKRAAFAFLDAPFRSLHDPNSQETDYVSGALLLFAPAFVDDEAFKQATTLKLTQISYK